MCEICSKLTIRTPEQCHWHHTDVVIVTPFSSVFIADFEQVNVSWIITNHI